MFFTDHQNFFTRRTSAAFCAVVLTASSAFGDDRDVINIAEPSWDTGKLIAHYIGSLIEQETDFTVAYQSFEGVELWTQLTDADGQLDIFPDHWSPNQAAEWQKFVVEEKSVSKNENNYNGTQGFYTLAATGFDQDTSDVMDFTDPEIIKLFDTDNNGKGEYWPGQSEWNSTYHSRIKINEYGLGENWEEIDATVDEFKLILAERTANDQPVLFYFWEPDALQSKYEINRVVETPHFEDCIQFVDPKTDEDWLTKSSFKCAYPVSNIHVIFRTSLNADAPLFNLLTNFTVDRPKLETAALRMSEDKLSIEDAIKFLQ